jgi:hypothetical protein
MELKLGLAHFCPQLPVIQEIKYKNGEKSVKTKERISKEGQSPPQ